MIPWFNFTSMKRNSIALLLFSTQVFAQSAGSNAFTPELISNQSRITSEGIKQEAAQFRAIAEWKKVTERLKTAEQNRDHQRNEFERMKALAAKGQGSEAQLQMAEVRYQDAENNVQRLESEAQRMQSDAFVHKLRVLEEGNPDEDYRYQISKTMLASLRLEKISMQASLQNARMNEAYYLKRLKAGEHLHAKKVISDVELEHRRLELQAARDQTQSIIHQIEAITQSVIGMEATQKKLSSGKALVF